MMSEVAGDKTAGLKRLFIVFVCFYLTDLTGAAILGPGYEANPLIRALLETSTLAAAAFRLALLALFTWAVWACVRVNYRLARTCTIVAAVVYAVPAAFYAGLACFYAYNYLRYVVVLGSW